MAGRKEFELLFKLQAALGSGFNSSFSGAINTTKQLQSTLAKINSLTGKIDGYKRQSEAVENSRKKLALLTEEHEKLQQEMSATENPSDSLKKKFERNEKQIAATTAKITEQEQKLDSLGKELQEAGIDTGNLGAANDKLSKSYERVKKSQEQLAKISEAQAKNAAAISATKGQIAKSVGAIAAGGAAIYAGAIKPAIEFESAFAGVKKTINGTPEQLLKIQNGIRKMATEIPLSVVEISAVAEAAGQLGIKTESILGFTRVMSDLGVATNLTGDEAATTLAKFANITGMSQDNFDRLGSTIVALGNNLATTEADIAAMGLRLAGAGKQVGMTEAQILSFSGALSSVGIEAEAGGSAFSKVMVQMQLASEKGGESLNDFASVAGMSSAEFKTAFKKDAAGAITAFIKGLGESEKKGISTIKVLDDMGVTEIRMRDALLRAANASDLFTNAIDLGTTAWEENTALQKEAQQRYATTESSIKIMRNAFKDIGATIGSVFLPQLAETVRKVSEVAVKFADFAEKNPELVKTIAKITAGLLGFKVATLTAKLGFHALFGGVLDVKKFFALFSNKTAIATAETIGFGKKISDVAKSAGGYFGGIGKAAGGVGKALGGMFSGTKIGNLFSKMSGVFSKLFSGIRGGVARVFSGVAGKITGIFGKVGIAIAAGPLGKIGGMIGKGLGKVTSLFAPLTKLGVAILGPFSGIIGKILPVVGVITLIISAIQILQNNLDKVREVVRKVFGEAGLAVFDKAVAAITNIGNTIKRVFTDGNLGGARGFLINLFGEDATGAIDGAITVIQTIWNILSQFITFVDTYIRPIVENLFKFIVETVLPQIAQAFAEWAPTISAVLQGIWTVVQTIATAIMQVIKFLMPTIQGIIGVGLEAIRDVVGGVLATIKSVVDVFAGIFTGDWSRVWEGVKGVFKGVFDSLAGIVKAPINAVISIINGAISGINKIGFDVPDWVPFIGGKPFKINIPTIPMLEKGSNFTPDTFIAGEKGAELVTNARGRKVFTAAQTGNIFGNIAQTVNAVRNGTNIPGLQLAYAGAVAGGISAPSVHAAQGGASVVIHSAPVFHVGSDAEAQDIEEALRKRDEELLNEVDERLRKKEDDERRGKYD